MYSYFLLNDEEMEAQTAQETCQDNIAGTGDRGRIWTQAVLLKILFFKS
jgi:hypothetical protein